jgi:hypothetical protein
MCIHDRCIILGDVPFSLDRAHANVINSPYCFISALLPEHQIGRQSPDLPGINVCFPNSRYYYQPLKSFYGMAFHSDRQELRRNVIAGANLETRNTSEMR